MFFVLVSMCVVSLSMFFVFKQKTAYEMRISDWSSDVCSSDLRLIQAERLPRGAGRCPVRPAKHRPGERGRRLWGWSSGPTHNSRRATNADAIGKLAYEAGKPAAPFDSREIINKAVKA